MVVAVAVAVAVGVVVVVVGRPGGNRSKQAV